MSSNDHDIDFFYIDDIPVHAVTVSQLHPGLPIEITLDGPQGEFHVATIDPTSDRNGCRYGGAKLIRAHARQQGEEQCGLCKLAHDSRKCPQLYDLLSYFPKQIEELEEELRVLRNRVKSCLEGCPSLIDKMSVDEVFTHFPMAEDEKESFTRAHDAGIQHVSEILRCKGHLGSLPVLGDDTDEVK